MGSETSHLTVFLGPRAKEQSLGGRILGMRQSLADGETADFRSRTEVARLFCLISTPESRK